MDSQEITSMLPGSSNCNKVSPQKKRTCRKGKERRKKEKSEENMLSESFTKSNEVTGLFKSQNAAKSNPRLSPKRLFSLDVRSAARGRDRYPLSVKSSSASNQSKKDKKCACIIPHNSNLKILWDWFVLILVLYTAVQIPYQAAFPSKHNSRRRGIFHSHSSPTSILGYVVDAMFLLDIFINFFTTFPESETEEIVTDHRRIAVHYLKTWFAIDFIAVIPFDWFVDELRPDSEDTATLFGLLKSARLLRLFRVARKLDRYSEYGVAVLFLLMSLFTLLAHWLACIWHVIGDKQPPVSSGWLQVQATDLGVSSLNGTKTIEASVKYIASLYFILSSLTSVGFGNVSANTKYEQIFMIIVMLLGALMYATVFGNMVAIVQRLYSKASRFHNEMNIIKEFLRFYKIPEDLRRSIQTYVRQEWTFTEGVDVQKVLKQFPMSLQMDICYELYQGLFSEVRALQGATVSCMRTMGRKFRTLHLQVGHYVLKQGDQVEHLFVIGRGAMEVIKDGELVTLLAKHTAIGYDFINKPSYPKANADIRASTSLELHYIHKDDLKDIMKAYPKFGIFFMENFQPAYSICDESEEGLARPSRTKPKLHLGAIAKTALRFSFLRFKAKSSLQMEADNEEGGSAPEEHDSDLLNVTIPNGHAIKQEGSNEPQRGDKGLVTAVSPQTTPTIRIENHNPSGDLQNEEIDERLQGLEKRICKIENQVLLFRDSFDTQMNSILNVLTDLKTSIDSKEVVTRVDTCRSNFQIEDPASNTCSTTSTF